MSASGHDAASLHAILDLVKLEVEGEPAGRTATHGTAWAELPASWLQGRTIFGGMVGALLARAMIGLAPRDRELRSLQVAFVAPVVPGRVELQVEILRSGRNVSHLTGRLVQNGEVCASALSAFGVARPGRLRVEGLPAPEGPRPDEVPPMPALPFLPSFVQHFDFRFTSTRIPFSGTPGRQLGGWCRPRGEGEIDAAALAAITDAWPGSVLPDLHAPAPASTVSWAMDFAPGRDVAEAGAWWQYEAHTEVAGDGYALSRAYVWDETGRLAVASRQTLAVFEPLRQR